MMMIGHRGACDSEPENTLLSFEQAIRQGSAMVEFDIHRCATGELVVIHDEKVDRTTDGSGPVAQMSLAELKTLDAGRGERIPTLEDVLKTVAGRVPVNIELKGAGTAPALHAFLNDFLPDSRWTADDFLVSSFDWNQLDRFKALSPRIRRGVLSGGALLPPDAILNQLKPWSLHCSLEQISPQLVNGAHNRGLRVFVYTVNDLKDRERLEEWGVDGIFTDAPGGMPDKSAYKK